MSRIIFLKKIFFFYKRIILKQTVYSSVNFNLETNLYHQLTYGLFIMCCLYGASFLPYGRFYNRLGGNWGLMFADCFILAYLAFPSLRKPVVLEYFYYYIYLNTLQLTNKDKNYILNHKN